MLHVFSKDESLVFVAFALIKKKRKHKMWVRDGFKFRKNGSTYRTVYELAMGDVFQIYANVGERMTPNPMGHCFHWLLLALKHNLLTFNILFLQNSDFSHFTPPYYWRILYFSLKAPKYVSARITSEDWLAISKQFEET